MRKLVGEEALAYARQSGAQLYHHDRPVDLTTAAQELLREEPGALSCDAAPPLPPIAGMYLRVSAHPFTQTQTGQHRAVTRFAERRGCQVVTGGDPRARR